MALFADCFWRYRPEHRLSCTDYSIASLQHVPLAFAKISASLKSQNLIRAQLVTHFCWAHLHYTHYFNFITTINSRASVWPFRCNFFPVFFSFPFWEYAGRENCYVILKLFLYNCIEERDSLMFLGVTEHHRQLTRCKCATLCFRCLRDQWARTYALRCSYVS